MIPPTHIHIHTLGHLHCSFFPQQIEQWELKKRSPDLMRFHIVGCEELSNSDLKSITRLVTASGHVLNFSVRDVSFTITNNLHKC